MPYQISVGSHAQESLIRRSSYQQNNRACLVPVTKSTRHQIVKDTLAFIRRSTHPHCTVMACIVHTSTRGSGNSLPWGHAVPRCTLDMQDSLLLGPMVAGMQDGLVEKALQSLRHLQARVAHLHMMSSCWCRAGGARRHSTAFSCTQQSA